MNRNANAPFPERKDLDMAAVGGDLYDFFIREEKLFFCIGDMADIPSLFRSASAKTESAGEMARAMHEALSATHGNATFFCGILNLTSGRLCYCNAGHATPVLLSDDKYMLPVKPFEEQETYLHYDDALFLYSDGLTEAANAKEERFGKERMLAILSGRKAAIDHLGKVQGAVHEFTGKAPNLTLMFIHYLNENLRSFHNLILHNNVEEIPKVEELIDQVAEEKNLNPSLALNLNLALEEAVTNVVLYAYPKGTDGTVNLHTILREGSIEFTIIDSGVAFDPTARPDPDLTLSVEERPIGGLGIFLVKQIMDKVQYERRNEKNYLRMTKKI